MEIDIVSKLGTNRKLLQKGAFVVGVAFFLIEFASVVFASPAPVHISIIVKMRDVLLEKGGLQNLLNDWDIQELQKIIDEKGEGGRLHRNNGSHDPSILEARLRQKGWPANKIPAAKNYLHIHVLEDIATGKTDINGHKVTYFDKIGAKYKIWRISHGWGYKPLKKFQKPGPSFNRADTFRYRLKPKVPDSTFSKIMRTACRWAVVIGILYEGYSVTKEVYQMKMAGEKVHPSRVLLRACIGFAGAIAGGIALGVLLVWLPVAGPIIGGLVGGFLGAVISEQLFELIMPLHTADWFWGPLNFLLGGVLGSILGFIFGIPYVLTFHILAPLKGFFLGGFGGSMLMLIGFTFI